MTNNSKRLSFLQLDITHRLICDVCHRSIAYYSFEHTERKFMNELKDIICPKCFDKKQSGDSVE